MKKLVKVQSISDVITNSSSEVFLMYEWDAEKFRDLVPDECLSIIPITWEYLNDNIEDLILDELTDVEIPKNGHSKNGEYSWITLEDWQKALIEYKDSFEKVIGCCLVDIEDHFVNCDDVYYEARDCCLASEYNH